MPKTPRQFHESLPVSQLGSFGGVATLLKAARSGAATSPSVLRALGLVPARKEPQDVRIEGRWQCDGIAGEEVSWSVGYGPRTHAWLLRPVGASGKLPGVLALHDHGNYKYFGKEKIADGPDERISRVLEFFRNRYYAGRAYANELARAGFAVLVPDVFPWGSRKVPFEEMPDIASQMKRERIRSWMQYYSKVEEIARYNCNADFHQPALERACRALGATLPGVIAYEDCMALEYLASRRDVDSNALGCIGMSGGGQRAGILQAICPRLRAAVTIGYMSGLLEALPPDISFTWKQDGDWPDFVASRAPSPLLVQYCEQDSLFTMRGMKAAHRRLQKHYRAAGAARNYKGEFYPVRHGFDIAMQKAAFGWLQRQLSRKENL
jgi:dienelactone hydrolase